MNTQKSVFNKISKIEREVESKEVELSEVQKVELSLLDDLDALEWLIHLQEELMDATLYIERLKKFFEK